jgi:hypothetical protein
MRRTDSRGFIEMRPSAAAGGTVIAVDGGAARASIDPQHFSIHHSRTGPHTVITYHNVDQVCDGVDKRPDPGGSCVVWCDVALSRSSRCAP